MSACYDMLPLQMKERLLMADKDMTSMAGGHEVASAFKLDEKYFAADAADDRAWAADIAARAAPHLESAKSVGEFEILIRGIVISILDNRRARLKSTIE